MIVYDKIAFIVCKNINVCFLSTSEREMSQNWNHEQKNSREKNEITKIMSNFLNSSSLHT